MPCTGKGTTVNSASAHMSVSKILCLNPKPLFLFKYCSSWITSYLFCIGLVCPWTPVHKVFVTCSFWFLWIITVGRKFPFCEVILVTRTSITLVFFFCYFCSLQARELCFIQSLSLVLPTPETSVVPWLGGCGVQCFKDSIHRGLEFNSQVCNRSLIFLNPSSQLTQTQALQCLLWENRTRNPCCLPMGQLIFNS